MSSVETAYHALKQAILERTLLPGERLKEIELAEQLGLSRTPVREAFNRLSSEGWLVHVPNQGVRVMSWGAQDIQEIFTIRLRLEPYACAQAIARITPQALKDLERFAQEVAHHAQQTDLASLQKKVQANKQFHALLLDLSGNTRIKNILTQLVESPLATWTFKSFSAEATQRSIAHHFEIVQAAKQGDPLWAEAIMQAHILAALNASSHLAEQLKGQHATA